MDINRMQQLRINKGLTRAQVAQDFNVSPSTYGKWELAKRKPDSDTTIKLAEYFNVSTDYLLGVSDDNTIEKQKKTPSEIQMSDVSYALFGEVHKLTDDEKEELLRAAKRMVELRELKEENRKRQG